MYFADFIKDYSSINHAICEVEVRKCFITIRHHSSITKWKTNHAHLNKSTLLIFGILNITLTYSTNKKTNELNTTFIVAKI